MLHRPGKRKTTAVRLRLVWLKVQASPEMDETVLIFAKVPRLGFGKSRIAVVLGEAWAFEIACQLLQHTLTICDPFPRVTVCFTPDEADLSGLPPMRPSWVTSAQGSGDLGERLARAFRRAFQAGALSVVVIGTDCPEIKSVDIRDAWAALSSHDLVVGPALDGGYWLLGMNRFIPEVFDGVPWSTDQVLVETLSRSAALSLRVHLLRKLGDIDTVEDWTRYQTGQVPTEKAGAISDKFDLQSPTPLPDPADT